jgi:hypothetical protein
VAINHNLTKVRYHIPLAHFVTKVSSKLCDFKPAHPSGRFLTTMLTYSANLGYREYIVSGVTNEKAAS